LPNIAKFLSNSSGTQGKIERHVSHSEGKHNSDLKLYSRRET